ncbi:ABC transporter permease [Tichowtungia aerotolerans]|uniref:ABC transporter permease n=1 Tax=Tichowtungia aerotolerans TaxID=2697043 RepID=A0A6P1M302_9BACT|nr:ABC transporter permease [Tichowtungia aerotolerans]QHI68211.1 ABC transporter permease [Tichowtungia aerotolerans]
MRSFLTLWRREFSALFLSPIAYVMLMFFLLVTGCGFYWLIKENLELLHSIQGLMVVIWACMLIVIPILTMRSFAEERKNGTFETLMTAPVSDTTVVAAKFIGVLSFFLLMCAPTLAYLAIIGWIKPDIISNMDPGCIGGGYQMVALIASAFIALGLFASALTSNQIIAAISTFAVMSILFFGGLFEPHLSKTPLVREVGSYMSAALHLMEASRGVFDSRSVVLYLSATLFFLFATTKAVSARR